MAMVTGNKARAGRWSALLLFALSACREADEGYAQKVFGGVVPYAQVLAERRSFAVLGGWGYTFAIVALPPAAPVSPPDRRDGRSWNTDWGPALGEGWSPTPLPPLSDNTRGAVGVCQDYWPAETEVAIVTALETKGTFAWRDGVGETVMLYSAPQGIAARLRYGD